MICQDIWMRVEAGQIPAPAESLVIPPMARMMRPRVVVDGVDISAQVVSVEAVMGIPPGIASQIEGTDEAE